MADIEKAIMFFRKEMRNKFQNFTGYINLDDTPQHLAIQALQEQAEREKGCEYCNSIEQQNNSGRKFYKEFPHDTRTLTTLDDAHLQIAFDDKSGWVLHFEDENGDRMFDIIINICPMCGRKLEVK